MRGNYETTELLAELLEKGFIYLRTYDDGETWRGTNSYGLKIRDLLEQGNFCGKIIVSDRDNYLIRVNHAALPTAN